MWIAIAVALSLFVFLVVIAVRAANRAAFEVRADLRAEDVRRIEPKAEYFGSELATKKTHGNCALVLSQTELRFQLWATRQRRDIPLTKIVGVAEVAEHLGRAPKAGPLIAVSYHVDATRQDVIAFAVNGDHEAWIADINAASQAASSPL